MPIEVLQKAFSILQALDSKKEAVTLADLTRRVGLPKPTVCRILQSLVELGYASRADARGLYHIASRLSCLGQNHRHADLVQNLLPVMERLHRMFNETINLAETSHGELEIEHFGFVDTKTETILPDLLQTIDLVRYTTSIQPVVTIDYLTEK